MERLSNYEYSNLFPDELIEILDPIRQDLRSNLTLTQSRLGSNISFWTSSSKACNHLVSLLVKENEIKVLKSIGVISSVVGTLCVQCPPNQKISLTIFEAPFREFLLHASSFINLQDPLYVPITKSCCRTLCNMVTDNEEIANLYFTRCLQSEESDKMISRLLAAKDAGIIDAISLFILNLIHGSQERCLLFVTTLSGSSIFDQLLLLASLDIEDELDKANKIQEISVEENEEEEEEEDNFTLAYIITQTIIGQGVFSEAYTAQSSTKDFLVSDAQLTLLKFLDGHHQVTNHFSDSSFLLQALSNLAKDFSNESRKKDARDVSTLQAVILLLAILTSIGLGSDEGRLSIIDVVEDVVVFLRISDTLAPSTEVEPIAIGQLKRSCVRLLGIVSWESKVAQDLVRETGGLTLLLGMCQINDTNITLREHALFAIRNVLKNNAENQALIEGLTPMYLVGKGGELRDLPPAMR